jgi:hypothetical protein
MVQMMVGLLSSISSQESATLSYSKSGKRSEVISQKGTFIGQLMI